MFTLFCLFALANSLDIYWNDDVYSGEALNGIPNGYGKEYYSDNCVYYGEFFNGKKVDFGIMNCPNENIYSYYIDGQFCTGTSSTRGHVYDPNACSNYANGMDNSFKVYIGHTSYISYYAARRSSNIAKHQLYSVKESQNTINDLQFTVDELSDTVVSENEELQNTIDDLQFSVNDLSNHIAIIEKKNKELHKKYDQIIKNITINEPTNLYVTIIYCIVLFIGILLFIIFIIWCRVRYLRNRRVMQF
jgi:hypothetical protein